MDIKCLETGVAHSDIAKCKNVSQLLDWAIGIENSRAGAEIELHVKLIKKAVNWQTEVAGLERNVIAKNSLLVQIDMQVRRLQYCLKPKSSFSFSLFPKK